MKLFNKLYDFVFGCTNITSLQKYKFITNAGNTLTRKLTKLSTHPVTRNWFQVNLHPCKTGSITEIETIGLKAINNWGGKTLELQGNSQQSRSKFLILGNQLMHESWSGSVPFYKNFAICYPCNILLH